MPVSSVKACWRRWIRWILYFLLMRPHPHFTHHTRKKSAFYTLKSAHPQIHKSAFYRWPSRGDEFIECHISITIKDTCWTVLCVILSGAWDSLSNCKICCNPLLSGFHIAAILLTNFSWLISWSAKYSHFGPRSLRSLQRHGVCIGLRLRMSQLSQLSNTDTDTAVF